MKVLITGATGFIGTHLTREICRQGHICRCLVRDIDRTGRFADHPGRVEIFRSNLADRESLRGVAQGIDVVYHLAAEGDVWSWGQSSKEKHFATNVEGTENLLGECLQASIRRFVHFSSTAAMGYCRDDVLEENDPCEPLTSYGKSKLAGEKVVLSYWRDHRVPAVILRPCAVYGPGGTGAFLKITRLAKKGIWFRIGREKNFFPLIHVRDVVRAALLAGEKGVPGEIYLIAPRESLDLGDLRRLILEKLGIKRPYISVPASLARTAAWLMEQTAKISRSDPWIARKELRTIFRPRVYDIGRSRTTLGFDPAVSIEDAVQETLAWFRREGYI